MDLSSIHVSASIVRRALCGFAIALASAVSISAQTEPLATGTGIEPPIASLVVGLILCIFLAYAAANILKNLRQNGTGKGGISSALFGKLGKVSNRVSIVETHRLSGVAFVSLVRCDSVEYLVLVGSDTVQVLSETPVNSDEISQRGAAG